MNKKNMLSLLCRITLCLSKSRVCEVVVVVGPLSPPGCAVVCVRVA